MQQGAFVPPKVAVILVTDQTGYQLARYAIASILVSQDYPFDVHLFCNGWKGPDASDRIGRLAQECGHRLIVNKIGDISTGSGMVHTSKLNKLNAVLSLHNKYERILYVDTDVLFFENIRVIDVDFAGKSLAAVTDFAPENLLDSYFNSGLMLFNTQAISAKEIHLRFITALEEHKIQCRFRAHCRLVDQCPLNIVFEEDWTPLPPSWNMQASALFTNDWRIAAARHYTGKVKFLPSRLRRADRRERKYIAYLSSRLNEVSPVTFFNDWLYYINGLRRYKIRRRMVAAIRSAEQFRRDTASAQQTSPIARMPQPLPPTPPAPSPPPPAR